MEEEEKNKSLFSTTLEELKRRKQRKDEGKFNCIPFPFKRLVNYLPGIIQGVQYIVTANSGVGKTQLTKFLFVYSAYKFVKEHPDSGITLKINYFALEESKEEFMFTMFSYYLYDKYKLEYSPLELQSMGDSEEGSVVSDALVEKLEECEEFFKDLEECLDIVDYIFNPTGIYKHIRNYAMSVGTFYNNVRDKSGKKGDRYKVTQENMKAGWNDYVPDNPDHYVINIVDHISLLRPEDKYNKHETMTKWSADYARTSVTKRMKHIVVSVQQQSSDKEKVQYTYKGESVEDKLEPSLDGLGDNKMTQRDALVVIGLFAPVRYGITSHRGINVSNLRDCYRNMIILKNRLGRSNLKLPLFFRGNVNYFEELPQPNDSAALEKYYDEVVRLEKLNFNRI